MRLFREQSDWAAVVALAANVTVVLGVFFAIAQIRAATKAEKIRVSIEAVNGARGTEFLKAAARLREANVDDVNLVFNTYEVIATLYESKLADRCLIKAVLYCDTEEDVPIIEQIANQHADWQLDPSRISAFLGRMRQDSCREDTTRPPCRHN